MVQTQKVEIDHKNQEVSLIEQAGGSPVLEALFTEGPLDLENIPTEPTSSEDTVAAAK